MSASEKESQQEGPDRSPPRLPDGYVAQWDGSSRKFYYVEVATGKSSWEVPDKPSASVPVVEPTPQPEMNPYGLPDSDKGQGAEGQPVEGERGFVGNMAMNALMGGKQNQQGGSSGLGGLASSLLSSGHHGSGQGGSSYGGQGQGSIGNLAGQLVGSLLDRGKKPQQQQYGALPENNQAHNSSGLGGMASSFFGHHGQAQKPNYGYSSTGAGGSYTGSAPPASYQPAGQQASSHNPSPQSPTSQQHQQQQQDMQNSHISGALQPSSMQQAPYGLQPQAPHSNHPSAPSSNPTTPYGHPGQSFNPAPSSRPYGSQQHSPNPPPAAQFGGQAPPYGMAYPPQQQGPQPTPSAPYNQGPPQNYSNTYPSPIPPHPLLNPQQAQQGYAGYQQQHPHMPPGGPGGGGPQYYGAGDGPGGPNPDYSGGPQAAWR